MIDNYCKGGHDFAIAKSGYFKQHSGSDAWRKPYNQQVAYSMLYCRRCGETREIISTDHRRKADHD
jgi:hypothetical protein